MPLRSQGYCEVWRGLSRLHWVWCNGIGPHLERRQEPQGSAPFLTRITECQQSRDKRVTPHFLWKNGSPLAFRVVYGVTGNLSNCLCHPRDEAQGCQCPFVLCLHPRVFLQRGVLASGSFQEWTVKLGSFGMWHHPRGYISKFLVRPASS